MTLFDWKRMPAGWGPRQNGLKHAVRWMQHALAQQPGTWSMRAGLAPPAAQATATAAPTAAETLPARAPAKARPPHEAQRASVRLVVLVTLLKSIGQPKGMSC